MHNKRRLIILMLSFAGMIGLLTLRVSAQDQAIRVGEVIKGPGGQTSTYCVSLTPDHANGLDALRATGLDINAQIGALGAAVCRIDKTGCSYPAETCFCQCQGNQCDYWSYFYQDENKHWLYSSLGPSTRQLKMGDVEGWLWNEGKGLTPVGGLPELTFDAICNGSSASTPVNQAGGSLSITTIAGFGVFGILVLSIGGFVLWHRIRSR